MKQDNQKETKTVEMPHLSIQDRGEVIGHHQAGVSVSQILIS